MGVGERTEIDVQRLLRQPHPLRWPPVECVGERRWACLDIGYIAISRRHLGEILPIRAGLLRGAIERDRLIKHNGGDHHGRNEIFSIARRYLRHDDRLGLRRVLDALLLAVEQHGDVFACQHEQALARRIARHEIAFGDDAIHDDARRDVEDHGQHHARADLQQRVGDELVIEKIPRPAAPTWKVRRKPERSFSEWVTSISPIDSSSPTGAGRATGAGPISMLRRMPQVHALPLPTRGRGMVRRTPLVAVTSEGCIASFASATCQKAVGRPRCR